MSFAILNNTQLKQLFLNKYLLLKENYIDEKQRLDFNSLKLKKGANPIAYKSDFLVFLSMFASAKVCNEGDKVNYHRNYNIPLGFLEVADPGLEKQELFKEEGNDFEVDNYFLGVRRSLINTFLYLYSGDPEQFQYFFSWLNQQSTFTELMKRLISAIITTNDYPQIEMSVQFAKSTKQELQFIYLGRLLGEVFFPQSQNKTDEAHRSWLLSLNPSKEIIVDAVPENFSEEAEVIIGYILSIKHAQKKGINIDHVLTSFTFNENSTKTIDKKAILFYFSFFRGLLELKLNSIFHTEVSSDLLEVIEKKAFNLAKDISNDVSFSSDQVQYWEGLRSKRMGISDKRYTQFCRMVTGQSPEERTEDELIKRVQPLNLLAKRSLIAFFKTEKSLGRFYDILLELRFFTHVLLVFKQRQIDNKPDELVEKDLLISSIKKKFTDDFPKIKFEIVMKNILDEDDRDVINNIRGFVKSYCTEDNFLYISDGVMEPDTKREALWVGQAFASTPLFDKEENYLFV